MIVYVGSDHAGVKVKELITAYFKKSKISFEDVGAWSEERVDYPDYAFKVAEKVSRKKGARGVLVCGTGTGMVIAANKVNGVRAAVIYDEYTARMAREDNDSNIACLRGRKFKRVKTLKILKIWLKTKFSDVHRHTIRIKKINDYERTR